MAICRAFVDTLLPAVLLMALSSPAHADLTVLVGEPFGNLGTIMPVGHTSVLLDRVCADGPLKLRMCLPGEPAGVVLARYHQLGPYDWFAAPVMQFLYAEDHADDIPTYATAGQVWELRQRYRLTYLSAIVPDGHEKDDATSEWWESAGIAYNRRLWGYRIVTTETQDRLFVAHMNADANLHRYNLRRANCAHFAADIVNFYYPGSVATSNRIADFGVMTPKQVVRCVSAYGRSHPEAALTVVEIPQVPGSLRRSRPVRGAAEALLKTKRYLATLLIIQPEIPLGLAILYLDRGRWQIGSNAILETPFTIERRTIAARPVVNPSTESSSFVAGNQNRFLGTSEQ